MVNLCLKSRFHFKNCFKILSLTKRLRKLFLQLKEKYDYKYDNEVYSKTFIAKTGREKFV